MSRSPGRLWARYLTVTLVTLAALTGLTQVVFTHLEGRRLAWHEALLFVVETMTTTGYGELLPFRSAVTSVYAIILIALGFLVLIAGVASIAGRWLASRFTELPPTAAHRRLRRHVLVVGYAPLVDTLHGALRQRGWPVLVVDRRPEVVTALIRRGIPALVGDGSDAPVLTAAHLQSARALVAVEDDAVNAAVLLTARHLRAGMARFATVEHAGNAGFLEAAGAAQVVSAKMMTGEALGRWAVDQVGPGRRALVLGAGDVGQAAAAVMRAAGLPARALSLTAPLTGADWLRGDATDASALAAAGIAHVDACVVALDDDARAVFATLVARRLAPDLLIAARANTLTAVDDLRLAGADYVLSVAEVAGDRLAALLTGDEEVPPPSQPK